MSATGFHAHVIGAGLAGLSAALHLAENGENRVTLYEATAHAGGLCRSFYDSRLDRLIDNGNHLILSGNQAVLDHVERIGATDRLEIGTPEFPFLDLADGASWTLNVPGTPLGSLGRGARPPGTSLVEFAGLLRLLAAGPERTVAEAVRGRGPLWRTFWEPLTIAVLNAPPEAASARLMRTMLARSFLRGAEACRPVLAREGLGPALIDPAVAHLETLGASLHFRRPLAALERGDDAASALVFQDGARLPLTSGDRVVLAVPPRTLSTLLPDVPVPAPGLVILNAHYRVDPALAYRMPPLLGLLGGAAQWVFRRGDVLSATVSAAETTPLDTMDTTAVLDRIWSDIARATGLPKEQPQAARLLKVRQATFDQSPASSLRRPPVQSPLANVVLAGAHVDNGLPCTLESAAASGAAAAALLTGP
ncbi:hydroxysqualene dehydroxylase HpnE [Roseibium sp. Sym1]|uniref:hydroxysqualene dehydroxylase HpnE n=1 Tax=Roseibium sp. Sym1 TaxID=3016006 RepID=UPI0022B451EC|nr:hydroxysqualene dehydroxylase HpnE [Roseibium sp. Sym1]